MFNQRPVFSDGKGGIDLQNGTCPTMTRILGRSFTIDGL